MIDMVGSIEVEYSEDFSGFYLIEGDDFYETNVIFIPNVEQAKDLIKHLEDFIKMKEK